MFFLIFLSVVFVNSYKQRIIRHYNLKHAYNCVMYLIQYITEKKNRILIGCVRFFFTVWKFKHTRTREPVTLMVDQFVFLERSNKKKSRILINRYDRRCVGLVVVRCTTVLIYVPI